MYFNFAPFVIPVVALVGAFLVAIVAMILKAHASDRQHRERMFLAEKGMEIPKELYELPQPKKDNGFRAGRAWLFIFGSVLCFVGIAVMIVQGIREGMHEGIYGIIPLFIGIALLAAERMIARSVARPGNQ